MSKKVLVFGASNSIHSINKKFANYVGSLLENVEVTNVDLNDYPLPIYGIDLEIESGIPNNAKVFSNLIESHDGIIVSFAEHNSNFAVVFKNLTDWISRLEGKVWKNKKMLLLSTSPGGRGGASAMQIALNSYPYAGAEITGHFSLPKFGDNFSESEGILNEELKQKLQHEVEVFANILTN